MCLLVANVKVGANVSRRHLSYPLVNMHISVVNMNRGYMCAELVMRRQDSSEAVITTLLLSLWGLSMTL